MTFRRQWSDLADAREQTHARRFELSSSKETRQTLQPLQVGDSVAIQNQHGNHPNKWDKTGSIAEALPHKQYRVYVDGSRRLTLRNRRFLRKIPQECAKDVVIPDLVPEMRKLSVKETGNGEHTIVPPQIQEQQEKMIMNTNNEESNEHNEHSTEQESTPLPAPLPRRSARERRLPSRFNDFIMG